jgi:hypothetical protein
MPLLNFISKLFNLFLSVGPVNFRLQTANCRLRKEVAMKKVISTFVLLFISFCMFYNSSAQDTGTAIVTKNVAFFKSIPVRDMAVVIPGIHENEKKSAPNKGPRYSQDGLAGSADIEKQILQSYQGQRICKAPLLNFEGINNRNGTPCADPNGDVGPDHYVQMVNCSFAVWDKSGDIIYGPADYQTIWASFPGPWNFYFWGDPVVKYDQLADRWIMISMALSSNDYYTMVAVSTSPDPLGSYYCYAYHFDVLNDYPKVSVWPDGYYMSYNSWTSLEPDGTYLFTSYSVVDRQSMLNGDSVSTMIEFKVVESGEGYFFPMPADCRGTLVPEDTAAYFVMLGRNDNIRLENVTLDIKAFHTNWQNPLSSGISLAGRYDIGEFLEPASLWGLGSPQLGSNVKVFTVPFYMMTPLTYRRFSDHESMVCCHTVFADEIHYIKWYELRREGGDWYVNQSGNYAPGDHHYFVPSIAMNASGDIALGYNVCSENMNVSIHFTGRNAEDPPGVMTYQELELVKGLYPVKTTDPPNFIINRWGDYSSMMVDPADENTFWFTSMYPTRFPDWGNWSTRIFSLDLSEEPSSLTINAGNDTLTCNVGFFQLQSHVANYSSITWTTSGDGSFTNLHAEKPAYLRGQQDISNHQVTLTAHVTGFQPGQETADSMVLYLDKMPEVNAGPDMSINDDASATLNGEVKYAYHYNWTTLGDGSFNDSSLADAIYTPGPSDKLNKKATLALTAFKVAPCNGSVSDTLVVYISPFGIMDHTDQEITMHIFPNPVKDRLTMHAEIASDDPVIIRFLAPDGKMMFTGIYTVRNHQVRQQFDLSYLPEGMYFIQLSSGNQYAAGKVLVKK